MTATTSPIITEQEYLKLEEKATVRHEFINGKMYEMPGGTMYHGHVISNLLFMLKSRKLKTYTSDMRVRPPQTQNYFYPDVVVTEEKLSAATYVEKPLLIAEVLSPSTRVNDLTDKFIWYRQIPSLLYYLLAEPQRCSITLFFRSEGDWEVEVFNQPIDIIPLPKLNVELPISEIYEGINL
jgi:Uma2 family endonuclease